MISSTIEMSIKKRQHFCVKWQLKYRLKDLYPQGQKKCINFYEFIKSFISTKVSACLTWEKMEYRNIFIYGDICLPAYYLPHSAQVGLRTILNCPYIKLLCLLSANLNWIEIKKTCGNFPINIYYITSHYHRKCHKNRIVKDLKLFLMLMPHKIFICRIERLASFGKFLSAKI